MKVRQLGRSGLEVTPICLGTWELGGDWGAVDERAATATVHRARELGINFFDTAQSYGFGTAERILGAALREDLQTVRDEIVLATKGGLRREGDRLLRDSSPQWLRRGVEESLRALGVDYVDLYQLHWPDPGTPVEESAAVLLDMIDAGLIRHAGVSNFDAEAMKPLEGMGLPDTLQPPLHMFRRSIEDAILPYCREHDIGVFVYGPLAHGLLTGTLRANQPFAPGDWRRQSPDFHGETLQRNLDVVDRLETFAGERAYTLPTLAIAWTLAQPGVHATIVGSCNPDHLAEVVDATDVRLGADDLTQLDRILEDAVPVRGPSPEGRNLEDP
jgi:aryl-alcohol dehydrogenase-like predicted oxidoreductase